MKRTAITFVVLGALSATLCDSALAQTATTAAGHWQGEIQIPDQILGVTIDLARNPAGIWIGSMSVSGTTAVDVPLEKVSVEDTAVRFTAGLPGATFFDGHLSSDATVLSGKVSNELGGVPFTLARSGAASVKVPPPSSPLTKDFEGAWEGSIESRGKVMRVGLTLSRAADGTATATLVNRDQGNETIPVTTVTLEDRQLQLDARAISGAYRGMLNANGQIAGEWSEGAGHVPLTFQRVTAGAKAP